MLGGNQHKNIHVLTTKLLCYTTNYFLMLRKLNLTLPINIIVRNCKGSFTQVLNLSADLMCLNTPIVLISFLVALLRQIFMLHQATFLKRPVKCLFCFF